jgi:hypothetical protein
MATQLPAGFESLEPFIDRFAVSGTAARAQRRTDSSGEERVAFHAAAKDLVGPALDMLDAKGLDNLDGADKRLLDLALMFAHVALAVEVQGPDEARHASLREYMKIVRSPADEAA